MILDSCRISPQCALGHCCNLRHVISDEAMYLASWVVTHH